MLADACAYIGAGQSAYGYATTVAEMVIMSRRAAGLPSLAIQWGVVGNVGYVAETLKVLKNPVCFTSHSQFLHI